MTITISAAIFTKMNYDFYISGAIIGIIQLPLIFTVHDTMGGSSGYVTIVSQWVVTKRLQQMFPYLAAKRCGLGNWWQVRVLFIDLYYFINVSFIVFNMSRNKS